MMSQKTPITLLNFFIYNSNYGPSEGEEEKKIFFYYPNDTDIDEKIKNIGLCEAIAKFTETFTDKPCQSLHTQKTRQLFLQPEEDFWMIMTLGIPTSQKTKDGKSYTDYHEDDIQDSVYAAVLGQIYKMYRLFMGSFNHTLSNADGDVQHLKQRLEHFFPLYLITLKLSQCDVLDVFNGIRFLPLDKNTYLRIQCFINHLETNFLQIKYTAFLYNDQLVWSGLEQEDMRIMYKYLTDSLLPTQLEHELQGGVPSGNHYGKFITGPPNLKEEDNLGKIPRVFVNTDTNCEESQLIVYKALSATVCMLVDSKFKVNMEFFRRLDCFLGPQMSTLASDISDQYSKRPPSGGEVQFKYVYFNHMNLAQKTTVHSDQGKRIASNVIGPDVLTLLADLNHDLTDISSVEDGELIVKTCTDCWVVGKKSDQREFYVVINQKNANLIEINEEVKKLCATNFSNIFFLD